MDASTLSDGGQCVNSPGQPLSGDSLNPVADQGKENASPPVVSPAARTSSGRTGAARTSGRCYSKSTPVTVTAQTSEPPVVTIDDIVGSLRKELAAAREQLAKETTARQSVERELVKERWRTSELRSALNCLQEAAASREEETRIMATKSEPARPSPRLAGDVRARNVSDSEMCLPNPSEGDLSSCAAVLTEDSDVRVVPEAGIENARSPSKKQMAEAVVALSLSLPKDQSGNPSEGDPSFGAAVPRKETDVLADAEDGKAQEQANAVVSSDRPSSKVKARRSQLRIISTKSEPAPASPRSPLPPVNDDQMAVCAQRSMGKGRRNGLQYGQSAHRTDKNGSRGSRSPANAAAGHDSKTKSEDEVRRTPSTTPTPWDSQCVSKMKSETFDSQSVSKMKSEALDSQSVSKMKSESWATH